MTNPASPRLAPDLVIDLPRLLAGRLLIQAMSGYGKTTAARRLLEQTHGRVQQLIVDPEGEFASLREVGDYLICRPTGGDVEASPKTAKVLARKLLETGASAVLDIYELNHADRLRFVRYFFEALVDAPKHLYHPVLIFLDEAHVFAPEAGNAESGDAVASLASRGRKRGFALCVATQRLSKLKKDVAAEMANKMIGRTGLDIDLKRALDELGLKSGGEAAAQIRGAVEGEFLIFGPALSDQVRKILVDQPVTKAPPSGTAFTAPPPPAKVRAILDQAFRDLPKEAETEAQTVDSLRALVASQKGTITRLEKAATAQGVPEIEVKRRVAEAVNAALADVLTADKVHALRRLLGQAAALVEGQPAPAPLAQANGHAHQAPAKAAPPAPSRPTEPVRRRPEPTEGDEKESIRRGARDMLRALAVWPDGYSDVQLASVTGFGVKGSTYRAYRGDLVRAGYITRDGVINHITPAGVEFLAGDIPQAPRTLEEVLALWRPQLRKGAFEMLRAVVDHGPITPERLAEVVATDRTGSTFRAYLGDIVRPGLVAKKNGALYRGGILDLIGA